jgi:hypothetical protein
MPQHGVGTPKKAYMAGIEEAAKEFLRGWPKARERLEEVLENDEGFFYRDRRACWAFWGEPEDGLPETLGGDTGGV